MSIHDFMMINDGIAEDPDIDLAHPSQSRKKKNFKAKKKKNLELKSENDLSDITNPIGREKDWGNREYKLRLVELTGARRAELITQMTFRLAEGNGRAYYMIGISDDGYPVGISKENMDESTENLESMALEIGAKAAVLRKDVTSLGSFVAEVMVNKRERNEVIMDVRVILLGAEGSGKSSLIGVLTSGRKDNGKGLARGHICKHKSELILGKTTSVSQHVLGFNSKGSITNYSLGFINSSEKILDLSSKMITFIDIAGSEKYAKSVITGMCTHLPDYALLVIDAVRGIQEITSEHLQLATALKLPLIVVITKIDKATRSELDSTLDQIELSIKNLKIYMDCKEDVVMVSNLFISEGIVPVFQISNVKLESLEILKSFLNLLPVSGEWDYTTTKQFYIDQVLEKSGVGKIVGGVMLKGTVNIGQKMLIGPDLRGLFSQVVIVNIHCKHVHVRSAKAGQFCSFLISQCDGVRPGMVMLDLNCNPKAAIEFECEITPIDKVQENRTIKSNYQPLINTQTIKQCTRILNDGPDIEIVPNQPVILKLRFLYRPEYIEQGTRLMIRDTFVTAIGRITQVFYIEQS
jgi:GTPase